MGFILAHRGNFREEGPKYEKREKYPHNVQ